MLLKEAFSKETFNMKNLVISLFLSVLYVTISTLFSLSEFAPSLDYGDIRPAIFFPALISILFGPIIGGLVAGVGNLLYDIIENIVIEGGTLTSKNLVGLFGNILGGFVTGSIAWSHYQYEKINLNKLRENFRLKNLLAIFHNVLAGILGFGVVVGLVIGIGLNKISHVVSFDVGVRIALSIMYWNTIFLAVALPFVLVGISIYTFYMEKFRLHRLELQRVIKVSNPVTNTYEITSMEMPPGDELFYLHWGAIRCFIKNTQESDAWFLVRFDLMDYVTPKVHRTPVLSPQEQDEVYFNIYGLGHDHRKGKLHVNVYKPNDEIIEEDPKPDYTHTITYHMSSDYSVQLQKMMNFFLFFGVIISIGLFAVNFTKTNHLVLSKEVYAILLIIPLEIVTIIGYYWMKSWRLTRFLLNATQAQTRRLKAMATPKQQKQNRFSKKTFAWIAIIYVIGIGLLGTLFYYAYISQATPKSSFPDLMQKIIILLGIVVTILFLWLEIYLEVNNAIEEPEETHLTKKFITSYVLPERPMIYKQVEIKAVIKNVTRFTGLRVFIHSYDIVNPSRFNLENIRPNEEKILTFTYIPLGIGTREFSFEFLNLKTDDGKYIPLENAETVDQETIKISVSKDSIFGLTPEQISMLKRIVTLGGAATLAITLTLKFLRLQLDMTLINTTIPLLLLLQAPVLYILFYVANKSDKILQGIE